MFRKQAAFALLAGVMSLGLAGFASGQNAPPPGGNPPGQDQGRQRGRGNFDPAQFKQMMMDNLRKQLQVDNDDEWKAIEPKVDKVYQIQRDSRGSGMGGMMRSSTSSRDRGSSRTSSFGANPDSAVAKAQADLESGLKEPTTSPEEIDRRMATLRQAKDQAKQDLTKAQAELKELLNHRQEAQLVLLGLLD